MQENTIQDKVLYILADSKSTDVYINIITQCVKEFDIDRIEFIHIEDKTDSETEKNIVSSKVIEQFKYIFNGKYNLYDNATGKHKVEALENFEEKEIVCYKKPYDMMINHINEKVVNLGNFYDLLSKIKKTKCNYIFDITTTRKDVLANIIPLFIVNNIDNIYYFEKISKLTHNQSDLWHNLKSSEIKYNKVLRWETLQKIKINEKNRSIKRIAYGVCLFVILGAFILILMDKNSEICSLVGTILSVISFVFYIRDNN